MQLDDAVWGESGCSDLGNVSLRGTDLAIKVEADLSSSEVQLEGCCQIVRDGLFRWSEAESVTKGPLGVSLGRSRETVDGEGRNVVAEAAEDEHVLRGGSCRLFVDDRPALLPLA